ncbi:MAG: rhomboid family intramembrane serine protease [Bacteroidetes bacterium]|nr:rhomboid family intramembrane serine protease [Bacteroidota bacterium]
MASLIVEDIKQKFRSDNPVTRLIVINVAVFFVISLLRILIFVSGESSVFTEITAFFIQNSSFPISWQGLLFKPWTLITYAFTHIEVFHIFWNMITLYWFGQLFINYTSKTKLIPLYILGGVAGALFSLLVIQTIPGLHIYIGSPMVGASAGVTAIIVAAATLMPNFRMNLMFIGEVKLIYVALFSILIDVLNVASYSNVGGNLAHLGGALMGYLFIVQYKKGNDLAKPISSFFNWIASLFTRSPK